MSADLRNRNGLFAASIVLRLGAKSTALARAATLEVERAAILIVGVYF